MNQLRWLNVAMGVTQARDGAVYVTVICPYTVLQFSPDQFK